MFLLPSPTPSRIIAVPSELIPLAGDGNSALFLAQVLFWWKAKGRQRFYKFNAPCDHPLYRAGDSWLEELGLKRTMFMTARRRVAVKVRISCREEVQQAFDEGALVVYGTDEYHLTWYMVNEEALKCQSPPLYARLLGSEPSPGSASGSYRRATPRPQPAKVLSDSPQRIAPPPAGVPVPQKAFPAPSAVLSEGTLSPSAEDEGLHSPMQDAYIGITTESPSQTAPEPASEPSLQNPLPSETIPLPTPPDTAGKGGGTTCHRQRMEFAIFTGLQGRGVQEGPARLIARRALRAGWDAHQTLAVFDAHHLDAKRAEVRSPVAVAVSRMVKNEQISLPPADTLARGRWLHQGWAGERRQEAAGDNAEIEFGEDDRGGEVAVRRAGRASELAPPSLKILWQQVLGDIKLQVTRATFEQRFKGTWLEERDGAYVVCAHDPHTLQWLAHRLYPLIAETLVRWGGGGIPPAFAWDPATPVPQTEPPATLYAFDPCRNGERTAPR